MPLVPAKCTICGAILTINSEKEAAICNNCGNAFIVEHAINNYNTYNTINADTVVVKGVNEEQLLKNGTTYIQFGDYTKAMEYYKSITEHFPDDYRGWWGLIRCETQDFRVLSPSYNNILKWFKYVMKLASESEVKQSMTGKYMEYLQLQAQQDSIDELHKLDIQLSNMRNHLSETRKRMETIRDSRSNRGIQRKLLEEELMKARRDSDSNNEFNKRFGIATVIVVILAIILFASSHFVWGIIVGFDAFIRIIFLYATFSDSRASPHAHLIRIEARETDLENFNRKANAENEKESMEYRQLEASVMNLEAEIKRIEEDRLISAEARINRCIQMRRKEAGIV